MQLLRRGAALAIAMALALSSTAAAGEPAKAIAPRPVQKPEPPRAGAVFDLPPVSEETIQSLADYLLVYMRYEAGYGASEEIPDIPGLEGDLEHLMAFRKPEVEGVIIIAVRSGPAGRLLLLRATAENEKLLADLGNLIKATRARIEALKVQAIKEILANAEVVDYRLSYIRADRGLGALKAMGYNVVEMTETEGVGGAKMFALEGVADYRLPIITTIVDSANTSLVEEKAKAGTMGSMTPSLGGRSLGEVTDSAPQQRLLIAYDPADPDSLRQTVRDIAELVDVPAQQILIEGMIVEVSEDKVRDLGVEYKVTDHRMTYSFERDAATSTHPLTIEYSDFSLVPEGFEAKLRLLIEDGAAEILSKPSILALNNYQARIRIGREIPISTTVATAATTTMDVSYFFMGIVLNIKPRISNDQKEVSMQVEAIVSSKAPIDGLMAGGHEVAPVIDSRVVQTFARVSNNTPFIIGGLISHDMRKRTSGIPLLMDIPLLGRLFKTTSEQLIKNEVIVVLTPRVVPLEKENYFAVIPKDSEAFEFLTESTLFRNTYRIRGEDKFDLTFVYEDPRYKGLAALAAARVKENPALAENPTVQTILDNNIPGETHLMLRMLYEVVKDAEKKIIAKRSRKARDRIPDENIIFFQPHRKEEKGLEEIKVKRLAEELQKARKRPGSALVLKYDLPRAVEKNRKNKLMPPLDVHVVDTKDRSDYDEWMRMFNKMDDEGTFESAAIVIQIPRDLERLKDCLILKQLLEINNFPQTLHVKDFPVGIQILYPNLNADTGYGERIHVVDAKVAQLFYISDFYYQAFQQVYHATLNEIEKALTQQ